MATRNAAKAKAKRGKPAKATKAKAVTPACKPDRPSLVTQASPTPAPATPRLSAKAIAALPSWAMCIAFAARDGRLAFEAGQPATRNPFQVVLQLAALGDGRTFDRLASAWLAGFTAAKVATERAGIRRRNLADAR